MKFFSLFDSLRKQLRIAIRTYLYIVRIANNKKKKKKKKNKIKKIAGDINSLNLLFSL